MDNKQPCEIINTMKNKAENKSGVFYIKWSVKSSMIKGYIGGDMKEL